MNSGTLDPGTYLLPANRSMKRLGLRGDIVAMLDSPEQTLRLAGMKGGDTEIPYETIESILVGIVFNKVNEYRTIVRCAGRKPIKISGRFVNYYSDFVTDLASEMERLGRLDRVQCGVPFILSWGPVFVIIGTALALGGVYQSYNPVNDLDPQGNLLVSAGVGGVGLLLAAWGVRHFLRWERPRPLESFQGVVDYLPAR